MGRFQEGEGGTGKTPGIQCLRPWHMSIAQAVALGNARPNEICDLYHMSPSQVSAIMGSPAFQAEVQRLQSEHALVQHDMAADIRLMAKRALEIVDEDMDVNPSEPANRKLRQNAALEVLGIAGIRKVGGTGGRVNFLQYNDNRSVSADEMDEDEVRNELMDLLKGNDGTYS
jgi:hypothetical protein